jgi:uncharacterized protein YjaG (DUF416 family)
VNGTETGTVKEIERGIASVKGNTLSAQERESVTETALEVTSETIEKCVAREITTNAILHTKNPDEGITVEEVAVVVVEDLIETRTVKEMAEEEVCEVDEAVIQGWIGNVSYVHEMTGSPAA